jgi:hypothetical protein
VGLETVAVGVGVAVGAGEASLPRPEPGLEWSSTPPGFPVWAAAEALAVSIEDWQAASGLASPATGAVTAVWSRATRETKVERSLSPRPRVPAICSA